MNIPDEAITLARKGGWEPNGLDRFKVGEVYVLNKYRVVLSPTFWQALGRELGWIPDYALEAGWGHYAHMFYRLILTGGDTTSFWNEILK